MSASRRRRGPHCDRQLQTSSPRRSEHVLCSARTWMPNQSTTTATLPPRRAAIDVCQVPQHEARHISFELTTDLLAVAGERGQGSEREPANGPLPLSCARALVRGRLLRGPGEPVIDRIERAGGRPFHAGRERIALRVIRRGAPRTPAVTAVGRHRKGLVRPWCCEIAPELGARCVVEPAWRRQRIGRAQDVVARARARAGTRRRRASIAGGPPPNRDNGRRRHKAAAAMNFALPPLVRNPS